MRALFGLSILLFSIAAQSANAQPTIQHTLYRLGVEIAANPCDTQARKTVKQVQNQFEEKILDERVTIRCKNLALVKYRAKSHIPPHEILESLSLNAPHAKLPKEVAPGATRGEVLAFAGNPLESTPDTLQYLLNDEGPDQQTVVFKFTRGRLASVAWSWSSH